MNGKYALQKMRQDDSSVRLPKLLSEQSTPQISLKCFDNFIFNDNFTRNRIAIRDLQKRYNANQARQVKREAFHQRRGANFNMGCESEGYSRVLCEGLIPYKKFQLDSVRDRDIKYLLQFQPTDQEQPHPSRCDENENIEYNKMLQTIQSVSRSSFRDYIQENKSPANHTIKLGLMNPRERRMTKQQHGKIMRASKLLLLQQYGEEIKIEQQYRKEQKSKNEQENKVTYMADEKEQIKQSMNDDQELRDIQKDFMSKLNFYVRRTIQQSGQYLIEPTTEQLHKIHLMKPRIINQHTHQTPSFEHVSKTLTSADLADKTNKDPHMRALEISKLMNRQDTRTPVQKIFWKALLKRDIFDVSSMLSRDPQLIGVLDARGNNSLHEAAKSGNPQLFATLLEQGGRDYLASKNHVHISNMIDWADPIKPMLTLRQ